MFDLPDAFLEQEDLIWNHMTALPKLSKFPQILYLPLYKGQYLLQVLSVLLQNHMTLPIPGPPLAIQLSYTQFGQSAEKYDIRQIRIWQYCGADSAAMSNSWWEIQKEKQIKQKSWVINYYLTN